MFDDLEADGEIKNLCFEGQRAKVSTKKGGGTRTTGSERGHAVDGYEVCVRQGLGHLGHAVSRPGPEFEDPPGAACLHATNRFLIGRSMAEQVNSEERVFGMQSLAGKGEVRLRHPNSAAQMLPRPRFRLRRKPLRVLLAVLPALLQGLRGRIRKRRGVQ